MSVQNIESKHRGKYILGDLTLNQYFTTFYESIKILVFENWATIQVLMTIIINNATIVFSVNDNNRIYIYFITMLSKMIKEYFVYVIS